MSGALFCTYIITACESIVTSLTFLFYIFSWTKTLCPHRHTCVYVLQMSTTRRQVMMESPRALGRLELTPGSGAVGVSPTTRLSGGHSAKETCGQRPLGPQGPARLNGCIPLSHQVAGHKYGVDTVGKYLPTLPLQLFFIIETDTEM